MSPLETAAPGASGSTQVFRIGATFVAERSLDAVTGDLVLEERPASDYAFFEPAVGKPLPDFGFVDLGGTRRRLSDFRGRHVLLHFWATHCGPCAPEMDRLRELRARFDERRLAIIGLSQDDEDEAAVKRFVTEHRASWIEASAATPGSGREVDFLIRERFRVRGVPAAFIVDPDGKVAALGEPNALSRERLVEAVERLVPRD
jgi:peroxiredoxin